MDQDPTAGNLQSDLVSILSNNRYIALNHEFWIEEYLSLIHCMDKFHLIYLAPEKVFFFVFFFFVCFPKDFYSQFYHMHPLTWLLGPAFEEV